MKKTIEETMQQVEKLLIEAAAADRDFLYVIGVGDASAQECAAAGNMSADLTLESLQRYVAFRRKEAGS